MSRVHELYHTVQELRLQATVLRLEQHRLRKHNQELKTSLEAAQAQIAIYEERYERLMVRWTSSHMKQKEDSYERELSHLRALLKIGAPAAVEVICMDARQYESLSVKNAGGKL